MSSLLWCYVGCISKSYAVPFCMPKLSHSVRVNCVIWKKKNMADAGSFGKINVAGLNTLLQCEWLLQLINYMFELSNTNEVGVLTSYIKAVWFGFKLHIHATLFCFLKKMQCEPHLQLKRLLQKGTSTMSSRVSFPY